MKKYYILILVGLITFSCNQLEKEIPFSKTVLVNKISASKIENFETGDTIVAGTPLFFDINAIDPSEESVLIWNSVFGDYPIEGSTLGDGNIRFYIPESLTSKSGLASIAIFQNEREIQKSTIYIKPLKAMGKIESHVGPRSLIVDKDQKSMFTAIPLDKYRNTMPEGYTINFNYKYPKQQTSTNSIRTKDFVAHKYLASGDNTGKVFLAANSSDSQSAEFEVQIEPGAAKDFSIMVESLYPYADARQHLLIRSSKIFDNFGNIIADGTIINFQIVNQNDEKTFYKGITIGGIVEVSIENPSEASSWSVQASLYGNTKSNQLSLTFISSIKDFEIQILENKLQIGPLIGGLGQMIQDGTPVELTLNDEALILESTQGQVIYTLPENINVNEPIDLIVKVLGRTKKYFKN